VTVKADWTNQAWLDPPSIYRGAPFWAWNDRLAPERLCRQIEAMRSAGMGGFFMHSRYGLKTPYLSEDWFECISACVEKARQLDMKAYLYDEDRWPSGAAGGIVTREHPEFGNHLLVALDHDEVPSELERLASFAVGLDRAGRLQGYRLLEDAQQPEGDEKLVSFAAGVSLPSEWFNDGAYLDVLSSEAVAEFIRVTHQAYADRYAKDFGGVIPAIFTDEPNYSHGRLDVKGVIASLPWTANLAREFKKRRGYDLRDHLPELVYPPASAERAGFGKVRHDYHRTVTELFVKNFSRQIAKWCEKHNIAMTGHYLGEESMARQSESIGSGMQHYEHQQWPGIDMLTDQRNEIATCKQCSSVAGQMGHQRVLSELYGCTGWDWPLEGHKFNAGWQYVLGVNFRCPHLSLYSLAGGAKRDYPASISPHSPWWKYYRTVEDHFARLGLALTQGKPVRDVLMLHPIESAWGVYLPGQPASTAELDRAFDSLLEGLLDQHYDYDLADEALLEKHGKVRKEKEPPKGDQTRLGPRLALGKMEYRVVVVPPAITLRAATVELLNRFLAAGGRVLFVGRLPECVDGEPGSQAAELTERASRCGAEPQAVVDAIEQLLPRRVSVTQNDAQAKGMWTMLRKVTGGQLLFVQSCDRAAGHKLGFSVQGRRPVVLWDTVTGERRRVEAKLDGNRVSFELELPPTGSALLSLGLRVPGASSAAEPAKVISTTESPGPWKIELLEPNSFPLDTCRFRLGAGEFSEPMPVLLADEKIRERFGLPSRANRGCQPWYLAQTGRGDRRPRGNCEMKFAFHVTDPPGSLRVAIERVEEFQVSVNGRDVSNEPVGWWVDEDLKTIDIASAVRAGENELLLRFDYRSDMELEDLHLIGEFGVRQTKPTRSFDAYTLVAPPGKLAVGSWVGQGLDFYGGAAKYRIAVDGSVRQAVAGGKRVRLSLPAVQCTCAAVHAGQKTSDLPWPPMSAEITEAVAAGAEEVFVEVIGGRKNILGPLHAEWVGWTGPEQFDPHYKDWIDEYVLNDHGLMAPPVFEVFA